MKTREEGRLSVFGNHASHFVPSLAFKGGGMGLVASLTYHVVMGIFSLPHTLRSPCLQMFSLALSGEAGQVASSCKDLFISFLPTLRTTVLLGSSLGGLVGVVISAVASRLPPYEDRRKVS